MAHHIILNNGGRLLGNAGADNFIVYNVGAEDHGVNIENVHATQDLRGIGRRKKKRLIETFPIDVYGRIINQSKIEANARLLRSISLQAMSKILHEKLPETRGKVYHSTLLEIKSKVMILQSRVKEGRKKAIHDLYQDYKKEFDD